MDKLGARTLASAIIESGVKDYVHYGIHHLKTGTTYSLSMMIQAGYFLTSNWCKDLLSILELEDIDQNLLIASLDSRIIKGEEIREKKTQKKDPLF